MTEILKAYTNPSNPGSFAGLSGFLKNNNKFSKKNVEKDLLKLNVYTQHTLPKRKFKRTKIMVPGIDDTWQADLVDVQKIKYHNKHYKYILTVIDCFSKQAWAEPIKFKKASDTYIAFKKIIENSNRVPLNLHIDGGNEFKGECKKYLESKNINLYITESKMKASIVERFNRTLKEKMWRLFTLNKNKKYVEFLPLLIQNYNNSYHRSIKNKPSEINKKNELETFKNLYGFDREKGSQSFIKFKFKAGDYVRCVLSKNLFSKGYTINWTDELFIISIRHPSSPPTYKIKSLEGELLTKTFYEEELQRVLIDEFPYDTFQVLKEENNKIYIDKLNSENSEPFWINKKEFLE